MSASTPKLSLDRLQRGDHLPSFTLRVTSRDVRDYLAATGESPDLWTHQVPPLALGAFALAGLMERVELPAGLVHTGQEYAFAHPVRHDAAVEVRIRVASRSERRGAVITALESEWHSGDTLVGSARTTVLVAPPGAEDPGAGGDA
ncbi:MAG: hypothetical protein O3B31_00695 [Chloroflexi bacterium]|nr:hypothetical protein [Chloroflexota bacterium]